MATITIRAGGLVRKDPADVKVYVVDWDTSNLGVGVTISTSVWTITAVSPSTTDVALTKDNESVLAGSRTTQVRLLAGTVGQTYAIANKVTTNESPSQTKERSFFVLIENQ
jgi:hypothetical protein